jgi:superfamily I DNA and/or RNA helicase
VDDYQGDENKIIILSLVRSNANNKIGFLKTQNRIIVALSRAQHGMFIVGDGKLLERGSNDWFKIISELKSTGSYGNALTLCCQNHPKTVTEIRNAKDFDNAPLGGCLKKCEEQLQVFICLII